MSDTPRPRGRPRLPDDERRSVTLRVRVRRETARLLEQLAEAEGVPAGELHHAILVRAVARRIKG